MKPPVRVYALVQSDGFVVCARRKRKSLTGLMLENETIHRYRLDAPKRKVPPSRLNVAGGVVRKKRKAKRGRKS